MDNKAIQFDYPEGDNPLEQKRTTGEILSLLGLLYDATTDINKWECFLSRLAEVFNAFGGSIHYYDGLDRLMSFTSFAGMEEGEKYLSLFLKYHSTDPRNPSTVNKNYLPEPDPDWLNGKPCSDRMVTTEKELHNSSTYNEVLKPLNVEHTIMSVYDMNGRNHVSLGLYRGPDDEAWTKDDCELLYQIVPHFKRAVIIHKRLSQLNFERRSALESLNQINMGLILADETQQILFANQQARIILDEDDGISERDARLEVSNANLNQTLNNAITEVIENSQQEKTTKGKCLSLSRASGKRDYSLLISPIWGNLMRVENNSLIKPIAAIFISDPGSTPGVQMDLLKQLYGLTTTETRIVDKLVRGDTIKTLALELKVQENTIRQHLKKIYVKTESESQSTLIQKIMSSPHLVGSTHVLETVKEFTMHDQEQVLSLIGFLYDATLDKNKWEPFLEKCCEVFNASSAQWSYVNDPWTKMPFTVIYNIYPINFAIYQSLLHKDPRIPDNINKPWHPGLPDYSDQSHIDRYYNGRTSHDRMFITTNELHKSEFYEKVLQPHDVEYCCAITHQLDHDELVFLGIMRNTDLAEFTLEDCELFDHLSSHVKQAAIIHRQLCQLNFDRRAALETLNTLNMGLVLVDQYQQILFANQQGQTILDESDGFASNNQSLVSSDPAINQKIKKSIQIVIEQTAEGKQTPGQAFSVQRPSAKTPYSVLISPLWNNLIQIQSEILDYPIVSVFIQDPETQQNTHFGLLKEFYKLTDTEAKILQKLTQEKNTKAVAGLLNVQGNTIRQHLKNIFVKTETNSQAELIQTIMASPLWLGAHEFSN